MQELVTYFSEPADGAIWFPITVVAAVPASPSNFDVASQTRNSLTLSWLDNASNENGYRIYRWNGSSWPLYATLGANATSYTDSNLLCNQGYSYRLAAYNNAGEVILDGWVDGSTTACPSPPTMPTNLQVSTAGSDKLTLSWQDNSADENGFNIYKWGFDGVKWDFFLDSSVFPNIINVTESDLECGITYYYQVSAFNNDGESARTNWVSGQTSGCLPAPPTNLRVVETTSDSALLAWDDRADNEKGFKIYRWGYGSNGWDFYYYFEIGPNIQSFQDAPAWILPSLTCENNYFYLVSAFNDAGESERVGWIMATTKNCPSTPTSTPPTALPSATAIGLPTATPTASPTASVIPAANTPTTQSTVTNTSTSVALPPTSTPMPEPSATATTMPSPELPEPSATATAQPMPTMQYPIYLPMLQ